MLLWTYFLLLLSATFVTCQTGSEVVGTDLDTGLEPLDDGMESPDSSDNSNVIRGLLKARQYGCKYGYAPCSYKPGKSVLLFLRFSPLQFRARFVIPHTRISVVFVC